MSDRRRKLTPKQVNDMRLEHAKGSSLKELADRYGVASQTVSQIVNGIIWKSQPLLTCPFCHKAIR